jgi:hypothetical protein
MAISRPLSRSPLHTLALALVTGILLSLTPATPAAAQGLRAWVLSANRVIPIDTANPSATLAPLDVNNLVAGDRLVGIDFRPQNGLLYGLGYNSVAGTVQLYLIGTHTSFPGQTTTVAVAIGATGTFVTADGTTPVKVQGTNFGFGFNPVTDRIRVVNDAGQNFRMNPNTGAFIDGDLGGAPVPGVNMDGAINGAVVAASGAAYTNNEQLATATTLYTLNAGGSAMSIQNPANAGTQTNTMVVQLNGTPLAFDGAAGFDIPPGVDTAFNDLPTPGVGYAALTVNGVSSLYSIELNGAFATLLGPIGTGALAINGLAIQGEEVPGGVPAIAITANNAILRFNTAAPTTATTVPLTGLVAGEVMEGIDWRPQTGQLFGIGVNASVGTGSATLYQIDPQNGACTSVGAAGGIANGAGSPIDLAHPGGIGFDFQPTTDRIRVVTSNGLNFHIDPNTGAVGGLDGAITGLPNGSTGVTAAAYTNSYAQAFDGLRYTSLYTLDPTSHKLFMQGPFDVGGESHGMLVYLNNGVATPLDFGAVNGFDIPPIVSVNAPDAPATGNGYAVLKVGVATNLYRLNLATGGATQLGQVGGSPQDLAGLAVGDGPQNPTTVTLTSTNNPETAGHIVQLIAHVTPATATGTVTFNTGVMGSCGGPQLIGGGIAVCNAVAQAGGVFDVSATYNGDDNHASSQSATNQQTVTPGTTPSTTTVTFGPNPAQALEPLILIAHVSPVAAKGFMTFTIDGNAVGRVPVVNGTAFINTTLNSLGSKPLTASYGGDATYNASTASTSIMVGIDTDATQQFFAEGATGDFFHTDLGIVNVHGFPATVQVTAYPESGAPISLPLFTMNPLTRRTIDLNATFGNQTGVSVLVASSGPVAATRTMTWGHPVYGSTLESGSPRRAMSWQFAEGATNVFSLFYLVENPNDTATTVTLTHLLEGGAAPVVQTDTVPAFTRRTYYINDVPGLRFAALSTVITADLPIVAERAMYLNTTSRLWEGGTASLGATALSTTWAFAEGATGSFFHTYLLLGNPNPGDTTVTVTYLTSGSTVVKSYLVSGESRRTIDVNFDDPALAATTVSMSVVSTLPIVAERAMWWGDPWTDGSASLGTTRSGTVWAIGEGAEGGANADSTFVLIAYDNFPDTTIDMTVIYDDGTTETKTYQVATHTRRTIRVADDFPNAVGRRFSVLLNDTLGDAFTAEVARYQSLSGVFGDGGGAALATRIR